MKTATLIFQNAVRLLGLILIALGLQIWIGHSYEHVRLHMRLGQLIILLLWVMAWIALRAGVKQQLVLIAILYGFLVVLFALYMPRILPGHLHNIVRGFHLLLGLGAIGFAEVLGKRTKAGLV